MPIYDDGICLIYIIFMMFLYVHPCMDVNTVTSCFINLHYVVWVLCYYVIMWFCFHDVMMSYEFVLRKIFIVNTTSRCAIKLHK